MAYFPILNAMINGKRPSDDAQAQAGAQGQSAPGQSGPGQSGPGQSAAPTVATGLSRGQSSSYISDSTAGNKAEQGQNAGDYTQINAQSKGAAARGILDANNGAKGSDISSYGGNAIAAQQAELKRQADQYTTDTAYKTNLKADDATKAVNDNNAESGKRLTDLLYGTVANPKDFAYNNKDDTSTDSYIRGLNTLEGRQLALRQQNQNSDYNSQSAGIDGILLGNSDAFKAQQANLVQQAGGYDTVKTNAIATAKGEQAKFGTDRIADQNALKTALGGMSGGLDTAIDTARSSGQSKIDQMKADAVKLTQNGATGVDANKYFSGNDKLSAGDVATDAQRQQFGRLHQLLTDGKTLGSASQQFGVNQDKLNEDVGAAIEAKKQKALHDSVTWTPPQVKQAVDAAGGKATGNQPNANNGGFGGLNGLPGMNF